MLTVMSPQRADTNQTFTHMLQISIFILLFAQARTFSFQVAEVTCQVFGLLFSKETDPKTSF